MPRQFNATLADDLYAKLAALAKVNNRDMAPHFRHMIERDYAATFGTPEEQAKRLKALPDTEVDKVPID